MTDVQNMDKRCVIGRLMDAVKDTIKCTACAEAVGNDPDFLSKKTIFVGDGGASRQ